MAWSRFLKGCAVAVLLALPLPVHAQVCQVPGAYATIDAALAEPACDEVVVAAGTYSVNLRVDRKVLLRGAGQGQTIFQPDQTLAPVILVAVAGQLDLKDVSVDGDTSGSGANSRHGIANTNFLQVENVEVRNFEVGVIDYPSPSKANTRLFSCNIHDNQRGIQTDFSFLLMQACTVDSNAPGGGVFMLEGNILDSTISNNFQQGDGGGIFIQKSGSIRDTDVIGNVALGGVDDNADGGGIFILGDSGFVGLQTTTEVTIDDSLIEGNVANGFGGGVAVHRYTVPPPPVMPGGGKGSTTIPPVGSQRVYLGNLVMTDSIVRSNLSHHVGGGVSVRGTALIADSVIEDNRAVRDASFFTQGFGDGGGVGLHRGVATIERTAIVANTASMNGGGIVNGIGSGATLTLSNATVARNNADRHGGGLYNRDFTLVRNATIAGNIADHDGDDDGDGGGIGNASQLRVQSSIIFDNDDNSPTTVLADCSEREPITLGYNLLPDSVSCPLGVPMPPVGPDIQYDPLQKPGLAGKFVNDDGTYFFAHRLGSIIADAGYCDDLPIDSSVGGRVDQRGLPRFKQDGNKDGGADGDGCDIGAFEIQN